MKRSELYQTLLSAPVNVTWEITRQCNLSCHHCLSSEKMASCRSEMTLDQCRAFIDDLCRIKVFQVNIGGGEPFLRRDILDILAYAHQKGLVTCVSTNGTQIDDALAENLAAMELLYLQVSLDGATAETNDQIRGAGTFVQALAGIDCLNRAGFANLSINTVVTRLNFMEITDLYRLGRDYRAKTRLSRFRPAGGAKTVWESYHLTNEQTLALADYLNQYKDVLTGDSFFSITDKDRKNLGLNMCGAAKMTCSVTPDGHVYPCAFLQEDAFYAGSILEQPLGEIWRHSAIFQQFRSLKVSSCESCPRFDLCHGGCPAIAYFLKHDLNCADPACICQVENELGRTDPGC